MSRDEGEPDKLAGSVFGIDGDERAIGLAHKLASLLGGEPIAISSQDKVLYHTAAVMAANYLTVLLSTATALHERAGMDRHTSARALLPLLRGTLDGIEVSLGQTDDGREALWNALTGPVRRGDQKTIKAHQRALRSLGKKHPEDADIAALYDLLLQRAQDLEP